MKVRRLLLQGRGRLQFYKNVRSAALWNAYLIQRSDHALNVC